MAAVRTVFCECACGCAISLSSWEAVSQYVTPQTARRKSAAVRCGSGGPRGLLQSRPRGAARVVSITSVDRASSGFKSELLKQREMDSHTNNVLDPTDVHYMGKKLSEIWNLSWLLFSCSYIGTENNHNKTYHETIKKIRELLLSQWADLKTDHSNQFIHYKV